MRLRCSWGMGWSVALLIAARPMYAAIKDATPADVHAQATRLQDVVAGCGASTGASPAACDVAAVGDDLRVGDPKHGGYEVHWEAVRDGLTKSKAADAGKRSGLLEDAREQLTRLQTELGGGKPAERDFARAKSTAAEVLAGAEFQRKEEKTWWDRLRERVIGWLMELFTGVARVGAAAPWVGILVEWLLFAGAAVGLLFFLLRNLSRQRLRMSLGNAELQMTAWDREATDWALQAEGFAKDGEWREAVHCLYWAAIVSLESRRAWRHNPTRTPREYLRLLQPGSAQQRGLRGLTRIFERVWYGLRAAGPEEYAEARTLYEALASGVVDAKPAESDAGGALQAGGAA